MRPQKREMYELFILTLENIKPFIYMYAEKKFYFHVQVNSAIFFFYITLPVCIFINTLNKLISMIFNSAVYQNSLKFLMFSRFGNALEKYEAFHKKLSILQNG